MNERLLEQCLGILAENPGLLISPRCFGPDYEGLASKFQGSALSNRDLRLAAETLRLRDLKEGENSEGVRGILLQVAHLLEQRH